MNTRRREKSRVFTRNLSNLFLFFIKALPRWCSLESQLQTLHRQKPRFGSFRKMSTKTKLVLEVRGFIILFAIFGLWPTLPKSKFRLFLRAYSMLCIIYVVSVFVSEIFTNELTGHTLSSLVEYSFFWSILFTHLVIVVDALKNADAQMRLIRRLSYVDWLFKHKLQLTIRYREEMRSLAVRIAAIVFILVAIRLGLTLHLNYEGRINSFWYQCMYSVWILRLRSVQIAFILFLFRARLRHTRDKLRDVLVSRSFYADSSNQWRFLHDDSKVFVLDSWSKHSLYDRLLNLKQIYGELYEICELINITFGWSLLTIIAQNFIDFTGNSYRIFCSFTTDHRNFAHAIDSICLLTPIVWILGTIVHYSSTCSRYVS